MYLQYIKLPCIQQSPQPNFEQREKFFFSSVQMHCIPKIPSIYIEKKSLKVWQWEKRRIVPTKIDLHKHCLLMLLANEKTFTSYRHIVAVSNL